MVGSRGTYTMLISTASTSSRDARPPAKFSSKSRVKMMESLSNSENTDVRPLRPPMPKNGTCCGHRKPRSLSVDFKSLETKRGRLVIDGVFPASSCRAIKSAVKHLYSLEDFEIDKEPIGCGFYALVYRVTHKVTKQEMVLKMNQMSSIREALLEIQTLNEIKHPNLLKFYGVCVHGGKLWCLTEFVSGGSLDGLIANLLRHLSWPQRVNIALDIAKGMCYLHQRNICHRDLTSKNILYRQEGRGYTCIVADFGLALNMKRHATKFKTGYMATPYWMAPECLRGKPYTEKADVFSYGIILGELMARVPADPAYLPRRKDFSLDVVGLEKILSGDYPERLFLLAGRCGDLLPDKRPAFSWTVPELHQLLEVITRSTSLPPDNNNDPNLADRFLLSAHPGRSLPSPPRPLTSSRRLRSVTEEEMCVHLRHANPFISLRRSTIACSSSSNPLEVQLPAEVNGDDSDAPHRHSVFYFDFRGDGTEEEGRLRRTRSLPDHLSDFDE